MSEQGPRPRVAPAPTPAWPVVGDASLLDVSVDEDDGGSTTTMVSLVHGQLARAVRLTNSNSNLEPKKRFLLE